MTAEIVSAAMDAGWLERNGAYGRDIREARSIGASSFANLAPNTNPDPDNRRADECPTWARIESETGKTRRLRSKIAPLAKLDFAGNERTNMERKNATENRHSFSRRSEKRRWPAPSTARSRARTRASNDTKLKATQLRRPGHLNLPSLFAMERTASSRPSRPLRRNRG